jgi:murein L,D-transpeptidase YcbB/YkuD
VTAVTFIAAALSVLTAVDSHAADPLTGIPAAHESELVATLYPPSSQALLWSDRGVLTAQARELLAVLRHVDQFGLEEAEYGGDSLAALGTSMGPNALPAAARRFDLLLSSAAVRLVTHLHYGRVDPRAAGFELPEPRTDLDVAATVKSLSLSPNVTLAIKAVEPGFYHYALLELALAHYRQLAAEAAQWGRLPRPATWRLHEGDAYPGATSLRERLRTLGDLTSSSSGDLIDPNLMDALGKFQERHGLRASGVLDQTTFRALETPLDVRVRQIVLTLERWRWLPPFSKPPIIVNIPEFELFAFETTSDRSHSIRTMPVIVGENYPGKRTPIFVGAMKTVVFRPYWDVPRSIVEREMLPKLRADSDYLRHNDLEIVAGSGDDARVVEATSANIASLADGQLRIRQRPGDDNALGLVKFLFPNSHDVYLHSTPARELFQRARRAFSHGCIRVSDPVGLAVFVLRHTPGDWGPAKVQEAMHAATPQRVELNQPIPVMILYGTAMATEAGPIDFFADIYGHDAKLEKLLGLTPISPAPR